MPEAPIIVASVIAALLSLGAIALSLRASRHRRALADTPTSPAAGVFIGDVEVKGTAECEKPLRSHLSERECVHHAWSIAEHWQRWVTETYRDSKGNTRTRRRLETGATVVASGGEQIPFFVRDASGEVLVRPEGADIEAVDTVRFTCGRDHPSYYGKGPKRSVADSTHLRTFSEEMIPIRHRLFVVGRARERSDCVAAEIAADPDARMFLITVSDERSVGRGYRIEAWGAIVFGLVLALVSAAILERRLSLGGAVEPLPYIAAACAFGLTVTACWAWMAFNSIVSLRQRVRRGWANIEVELARRADLLPNIAGVVKASAMHERDTQQVIALLRAQAGIEPTRARDAGVRVQGVGRALVAIAEAYPAIGAQASFLALQRELANTETRLAIARTYYNGIATAFNARLVVLPDRVLALVARLKPFELFHATDLERRTPIVDLSGEAQSPG